LDVNFPNKTVSASYPKRIISDSEISSEKGIKRARHTGFMPAPIRKPGSPFSHKYRV
jgi:hypothetical protein